MRSILFVGGALETNVALSLHNAALSTGMKSKLMDVAQAFAGHKLLRSLHWRFNDRRPVRIDQFAESVVEECRRSRPEILIATGIAPLTTSALRKIAELGIVRANFQTDDPWNPAHRSNWYLNALPEYDHIFSPRSATRCHRVRPHCVPWTCCPARESRAGAT